MNDTHMDSMLDAIAIVRAAKDGRTADGQLIVNMAQANGTGVHLVASLITLAAVHIPEEDLDQAVKRITGYEAS